MIAYQTLLQKRYSSGTVTYAITVLHAFITFSGRHGALQISSKDVRTPKSYSRPHLAVSDVEYVTILTWIKPDTIEGLRDSCLIRLLYDTGARISEICALQVADLDLVHRCAYIPNAQRNDEGWIFWGHDTNKFLKYWVDQRPKELFPGVRTCQRIIQKYVDLAKIGKKVTAHSFRHSLAHRVLDQGGNVKEIQTLLRHKSPISSFRYLELNVTEKRKIATKYLGDFDTKVGESAQRKEGTPVV